MPHPLPAVLALLACLALAAPSMADEAAIAREYHQRMKQVRKSGKPDEWLRLSEWVEQQEELSEQAREAWTAHTRRQYGVAVSKRIKDDDVRGWLDLAATMKKLMGDDNVARSYLRKALRKNPDHPLVLKALEKDENSKKQALVGVWEERKKKADGAGTAAAFRDLAAWCAGQRTVNPLARDWYDYARAREVYLAQRQGGPDDPIHKAVQEGKKKRQGAQRPLQEPVVDVPSYLPARDILYMSAVELGNGKAFRTERGGHRTYTNTLPTKPDFERVWQRGPPKKLGAPHRKLSTSDDPVWWQLTWDSESSAWLPHTKAAERMASARRIGHARSALVRARRVLADANTNLQLGSKARDTGKALKRAEEIARGGGMLHEFRSALRTLRGGEATTLDRETKRREAERQVEAWTVKLAELEKGG